MSTPTATSSTTATTRAPTRSRHSTSTRFPYSPVFRTTADETVKAPAWLNDRTMYHNRGDSTFVGENSEYGDFFGLDDLFTERPEVVDGMVDIFETWVTDVGIDGFRIDTAKHVNIEFWQKFGPGPPGPRRQRKATTTSSCSARCSTRTPPSCRATRPRASSRRRSTSGSRPGPRPSPRFSAATDELRDLFALDDYYTDADSNAYSLPTFLGNHDIGRIGRFIAQANPGARRRAAGPRQAGPRADVPRPRHAGRVLRRRAGLHRRRRRQGRAAGHDAEPGRLLQRRRPDRDERHDGRRELRRGAPALRVPRRPRRAQGRPPGAAQRRPGPSLLDERGRHLRVLADRRRRGDRVRRRAQQRRDREDPGDPDVLGRRRLQRDLAGRRSAT